MDRPFYKDFMRQFPFRHQKMAFVTGPRQVGKTTLAEQLLDSFEEGHYYNWDDLEFKRVWAKNPKTLIPEKIGTKPLIVFDELHKAPRWKSTLKGIYDLRKNAAHILVTGSAKLDVFRRGGDSLLGRYFLLHLHPFSVGEINGTTLTHPDELPEKLEKKVSSLKKISDRLFQFGGFPEVYLKADKEIWNLWKRTRLERLVREDLLTLAQTHELSLVETYATLLPERVGSPFSLQSIAEELQLNHPTAKRWLNWLIQLFYIYSIPPYSKRLERALKKQPKIYLWDWSEVEDECARFENMVASHILKACHFWTDSGKGTFELFYVRDKEKREVDLLVVRDRKPWMMVECKLSNESIASDLISFSKLLQPSLTLQVINASNIHERFDIEKGRKGYLMSADTFLTWF